jgi:dipeptidyl aminopeptidase/acylaminoacyl peptidase
MPTLAVVALALAAAQGAGAPFGADDLLALDRVSSPAMSPDGSRVAFVVSRPALGGDRLASSLWVVAASGGEPHRLTRADERVSGPAFSPDGKRVAFVSDRGGGEPQAWVIDLAGGEALQASALPTGADAVLWTPDGKALLVLSDVDPACGADARCAERAQLEAKGKPHATGRLLFRHWNAWRDRVRSHVLRVPLDGGAPIDLTPGDRDVPPAERGSRRDLAVSAETGLLYFVAVSDAVEATSTNADVYAVPLAGGEARRITSGPGWDGSPRPSPDGKLLAWLSQPRAGYESDRFHVMVAGADGGSPRDLTASSDLSADELYWADRGRAIRFLALSAGVHRLYEVEVATGKVRALTPSRNLSSISATPDGRVAAALVDSLTSPPEVALVDRAYGGGVTASPRTSFAATAMARFALGTPRRLDATGKDGQAIHGWIVTPPGHRPGERHPAVVLVHGGPQGAWTDGWSWRWNPMVYAARGFTVVMPNPRGSTGYGQAYTDAVRENWGGTPFDDVMALTDAAIASGDADGGRMCAAGASYGGYMVNWINGHTDRFRCLVVHAGPFDLEMSYYDTEELWFPEWEMGGPPYERPEAYARWSPHRFVSAWKTPTLVSHGELDYRVTLTQGLGTFTALQRRGVESRLLVFPDEGHWIAKPKNAKAFHDVVLGWLSEHLAAASPQASKAP